MTASAIPTINLIPKARQRDKARRARTRRWGLAIGLYGSLVALAIVVSRMVWVFDSQAIGIQLAGLQSEIENSEAAIKSLKAEIRKAQSLWETRNVVLDQADWSILLALIAQQLGDDVALRSWQLKKSDAADRPANAPISTATQTATAPMPPVGREPFSVTIAGLGLTQSAVSQFVLRLEQMEFFQQVRLMETRREPFKNSEAVGFKVVCTLE